MSMSPCAMTGVSSSRLSQNACSECRSHGNHSTARRGTEQHSTQHTAQHSTAQHSTAGDGSRTAFATVTAAAQHLRQQNSETE